MARPAKTKKTTAAKAVAPAKVEKAAEVKAVETPVVEEAQKPACKTTVCVELNGLSVAVADVQTAVKKAVKEKGLDAAELKIYINTQEQAAYYTVDGNGGEEFKVDLKTL